MLAQKKKDKTKWVHHSVLSSLQVLLFPTFQPMEAVSCPRDNAKDSRWWVFWKPVPFLCGWVENALLITIMNHKMEIPNQSTKRTWSHQERLNWHHSSVGHFLGELNWDDLVPTLGKKVENYIKEWHVACHCPTWGSWAVIVTVNDFISRNSWS